MSTPLFVFKNCDPYYICTVLFLLSHCFLPLFLDISVSLSAPMKEKININCLYNTQNHNYLKKVTSVLTFHFLFCFLLLLSSPSSSAYSPLLLFLDISLSLHTYTHTNITFIFLNLDHLIKVVFSRLCHCKVLFFSLQLNSL